ncbi:MAG: transcription termination factor Rho [Acidobacteria bacterium]|nr:MAG: transcription termination factor Rho [Acidobacteriota bacterium]
MDETTRTERGGPAFEEKAEAGDESFGPDGNEPDGPEGDDEGPEEVEAAEPGEAGGEGDRRDAVRRRRRRRRRRGRGPRAPEPASRPPAEGGEESEGEPVPAAARREAAPGAQPRVSVTGIVKLHGDHSAILVSPETWFAEKRDPFVPKFLVEAEDLEDGLLVTAEATARGGKGPLVQKITAVEGMEPTEYRAKYVQFHKGVSIDPLRRLRMETVPDDPSGRVLDLVAPIGRGQRCLIVAPPKAGKTTLLKVMANAIAKNDPDVKIFMLLVDERPEEVTDMQRSITGEVIASPTDMNAAHHIAVSELCFERAKRLVEIGRDVVIFCDSITRMSRAYNNEQRGSGKIMSGGIDARTMEKPRRFFGGARNHEDGGSLTIVATCLIDTGSRMDDVIFEEFKGTGNCEIVLDRALFERRIFPCINIPASGTRKEEKLYDADELPKIHKLRRALAAVKPVDAMELLLTKLARTKLNKDFLKSIL